jgi:hypothetical protein
VSPVRRTGIRRLLLGTGERNSGLDATWWAIGAIVLTVAAVGGLLKGQPLAALFFVPAIVQLIVAIRKAKEGNL